MGSCQNLKFTQKLAHFTISLLLLLISCSTQFGFFVQGRPLVKPVPLSQEIIVGDQEKAIVLRRRPQIGSRPPRCEMKCSSCGHCEAIQVPTNPAIKDGRRINSTTAIAAAAYYSSTRGYEDYSNYKPMSWKCKCGNLIFNP